MDIKAIDWPHMLHDLVQRGWSVSEIARRSGIARTTINRYLVDSIPNHHHGEILISEWVQVTGRRREKLPVLEEPVT